MTDQFDLYHGYYGRLGAEAQSAVRRETWDEDVGQSSWITLAEAREWFRRLELGPGRAVLEVACGSGGMTCRMALDTGATCVGLDINPNGIEAAKNRALEANLSSRVSFQLVDAGRPLPFPDESFDAIFCNDSMNHIPGRAGVLRDWYRVLRPAGRALLTESDRGDWTAHERGDARSELDRLLSVHAARAQRASPGRGGLRRTRGAGRDRGGRINLAEVARRPCAEARGARPRRRRRGFRESSAFSGDRPHARGRTAPVAIHVPGVETASLRLEGGPPCGNDVRAVRVHGTASQRLVWL